MNATLTTVAMKAINGNALTEKQAEKLGRKVKLICNDAPLDSAGDSHKAEMEKLVAETTKALEDAAKQIKALQEKPKDSKQKP